MQNGLREVDIFTRSSFLHLQKPGDDGVTVSYPIRFLDEPRKVLGRWGRTRYFVHVQLITTTAGIEKGMYNLDMSNVVLRRKLVCFLPLEDKTFAITNLGKVPGKNHYEYEVKPKS